MAATKDGEGGTMDVRATAKILQGRRWSEIGFSGVKREGHAEKSHGERQRMGRAGGWDLLQGSNDDEHGHVIQRARRELKEKSAWPSY